MTQLELEYGVFFFPDTLHIIHRISWCKTTEGVPQEASRVQLDEEEIDRYSENHEKARVGVPSVATPTEMRQVSIRVLTRSV
jgi:hypothetical protein